VKYTPGIGVRVFTIVGVIRLDLAYNPYAPRAGSAFFDTPISQGGQLFCVSPGNTLPVTGLGRPDQPPAQASGACIADFRPPAPSGFLRKLNLTFGIGQAY
jgi:outer membrane protein insertion porin family/translocation and assembly module TamA